MKSHVEPVEKSAVNKDQVPIRAHTRTYIYVGMAYAGAAFYATHGLSVSSFLLTRTVHACKLSRYHVRIVILHTILHLLVYGSAELRNSGYRSFF